MEPIKATGIYILLRTLYMLSPDDFSSMLYAEFYMEHVGYEVRESDETNS